MADNYPQWGQYQNRGEFSLAFSSNYQRDQISWCHGISCPRISTDRDTPSWQISNQHWEPAKYVGGMSLPMAWSQVVTSVYQNSHLQWEGWILNNFVLFPWVSTVITILKLEVHNCFVSYHADINKRVLRIILISLFTWCAAISNCVEHDDAYWSKIVGS